MIDKLKALALPILLQCGGAFVVTFLSTLVASGWFDVNHVTDLSLLQKAAIAGLGAVIALVRSLVAAWLSKGNAVTLSAAVKERRS